MPAMPFTDSSSGSVICDSITSALAPTYEVLMLTMGGSTLGYSRMPMETKPITPKSTIAMDITVASTGRFMLSEDKLMVWQ